MRFLKDPSVTFCNMNEGQWVGRTIDMRMEDLIHNKDLDVDKKLIKGFQGFGDLVGTQSLVDKGIIQGGQDSTPLLRSNLLDCTDDDFKKSTDSRFVKVHEVYLRPNRQEKNEGKKGWILLLTDEQKKPLRITEWNVKAEGFPAQALVMNEVPDRMFPMPDIDVYRS